MDGFSSLPRYISCQVAPPPCARRPSARELADGRTTDSFSQIGVADHRPVLARCPPQSAPELSACSVHGPCACAWLATAQIDRAIVGRTDGLRSFERASHRLPGRRQSQSAAALAVRDAGQHRHRRRCTLNPFPLLNRYASRGLCKRLVRIAAFYRRRQRHRQPRSSRSVVLLIAGYVTWSDWGSQIIAR